MAFQTQSPFFLGESPSAMVTTTFGTHLVEEMLIQVSEGMLF